MKIIEQSREINRSGEFQEAHCGIKPEGMPFILSILRDKIYSDKIGSICREALANALDSMVESGKGDKPIEISIPTQLQPIYSVRDFGKGLSNEDMVNVFIQYGSSTKRNRNDLVGFLGLGAKNPLCYQDSFLVTSFHSGYKTDYTLYIDESGVGKLATLSKEKSDQPTGLLITVPVKPSDYDEFRNKTFKMIKYFKTTPIVKGVPMDEIPKLERHLNLSGDDWCYIESGESVAVMGPVSYPISYNSFYDKLENKERAIISSGFELSFDIGELQPNASREALEYTSVTISSLKSKCQKVLLEVEKKVQDAIINAPDLLEASRLYQKFCGYNSICNKISSDFNIKWNGIEITDSAISILKIINEAKLSGFADIILNIYSYHRGRRYNGAAKLKTFSTSNFTPDGNNIYVVNNLNIKHGIKARVQRILETNNDKQICVFKFTSAGQKAFTDYTKVDLSNWLKLGDFESVKQVRIGGGGGVKASGQFCTLSLEALQRHVRYDRCYRRPYDAGKKSDIWESDDGDYNENTGGIYINIKHSTPEKYSLEHLNKLILNARNIFTLPEIVGVRRNPKLADCWISFDEWLTARFEELIDEIDIDELKSANEQIETYGDKILLFLRDLPEGHLIVEFFEKLDYIKDITKEFGNGKVEAVTNLAELLKKELKGKTKHSLENMFKEIEKKYPLLFNLDGYYKNEAAIRQYVEAIDCLVEKVK